MENSNKTEYGFIKRPMQFRCNKWQECRWMEYGHKYPCPHYAPHDLIYGRGYKNCEDEIHPEQCYNEYVKKWAQWWIDSGCIEGASCEEVDENGEWVIPEEDRNV